jgi:hypothetical protein
MQRKRFGVKGNSPQFSALKLNRAPPRLAPLFLPLAPEPSFRRSQGAGRFCSRCSNPTAGGGVQDMWLYEPTNLFP